MLLNLTIEKNKQVDMPSKCPECGSSKIKLEADEYLCGKCGLVLSESIFLGDDMVA